MPEGKLSKKEFYDKYYPIVKDTVEGTGLFPETVIAQMAIESGWGGSGLTTKYNNFFGIKGGKNRGVSMDTEEEVDGKRVGIKDNFRVYNSVEDSIKDYVSLLKNNNKYSKVFEAKTPEEQAELIGQTPYSTSSNYGNSIKQTVMANKDKTKVSENTNTNLQVGDINSKEAFNKEKEKLEYLKKYYPKLYPKAKKEFEEKSVKFVQKATLNKLKNYQEQIDVLEKNGNFKEADVLRNARDTYVQDNKYLIKKKQVSSFSGTRRAEKGEKMFAKNVYGKDMFTSPDIDLKKVYETIDKGSVDDLIPEEKELDFETKRYDVDVDYTGGGPGGSSSATTTINIEDRPDRIQRSGSPADVDDYKKSVEDYEQELGQLQQEEQELLELEKYNFQPSESVKHDNDVIGSLIDAGRGVMGMIGVNKDIPEYQRGEMFSEAMGDAFDRRDQGLTPEEMSLRERQGEETYAYDIKNISRASGGSAGVFLGNMGSAAKRLYADKAQMATENEAVRRMNRQNFQGMALQDEQINRRIFEDDLNQVMMTKQAGAGLVQDAFNNIKERSDYNKQYGKGSIYDRYMNAKIADTEESRYARNFANKQRMKSLLFENKIKQDKTKKLLENSQVLDASFNKDREKKYEEDEVDFFNSLDFDNYRL